MKSKTSHFTPEQIDAWKKNRRLHPLQVVALLPEEYRAKEVLEIVGKDAGAIRAEMQLGRLAENADKYPNAWLWLTKDLRGTENKEKREALSALGFKFNKKRLCYQHPCGRFARFNPETDPREKYEVA